MRIEHDLLGPCEVPADAYFGIHTVRARENFHLTGQPIHKELVAALVVIKKAAALTNISIGALAPDKGEAITAACDEILAGALCSQFVVDCLQGGAGTSANMNVNEVIANRAIEHLGGQKGDYNLIHPLDHVNLHQSTNDVFPTAVRIAAIRLLKPVTESFANLQSALQEKEEEFSRIIKAGRTQLQDAVPVTLGQEFGAWAQAISRDRWRLYKAEERLRQVNIGGTAVGTGLNAPRSYIFTMIEKLRDLTGISLARIDYMMDPTQNCDVFVEVSGLLKTAAVNQVAFQIIANDTAITLAAMSGQLELNAFLPVIAKNLFEELDLLRHTLPLFSKRCIAGITANEQTCREHLENSTVMLTALTAIIGYDKGTEAALILKETGKSIKDIILEKNWMTAAELDEVLKPERLTSPSIDKKH